MISYNLEFFSDGKWAFFGNFTSLEKLNKILDEEINQNDYRVTECRVVFDTTAS